jgi:hypothetical protein
MGLVLGLWSLAILTACTAQAPDSQASAVAPPAGSAAASPAPVPVAAPVTLLDVFPAAPERELVLANCGSCHNAACAAIGQRPAARWDALLVAHRDRLSGVDLDKVFGYLKAHFNDGRPEPKVPPALLEGGCTPF